MKAFISGQAGIAILIDGDSTGVVKVEHPEQIVPCQRTDILWLLADAEDMIEFDRIERSEAVEQLFRAWKQDRALQMILIVSDRTQTQETRQRAAALLDSAMQHQNVTDFVSNQLYAAPLNSDLDAIDVGWLALDSRIRPFLDDLRLHQDAISVSRGAWNSLPPRLFVELVNRPDPNLPRMEMAAKAKDALERAMVSTGIFRLFALSIHAGMSPNKNPDILAALRDPGLVRYQPVLQLALREWVEASGPRSHALLRVQLLGTTNCLRLKKYAQLLVDWLDDKARGRSHWDLLRDAAVRALAQHNQPQEDIHFETNVQRALGDVASDWFKEPEHHQIELQTPSDIWSALSSLSDRDLLKLKKFARWRIKGLGRKALGRDEKDLLEEAITATASGERAWNQRVDLCSHLLGAMRSISSSWRERKVEEYLESELTPPGGVGPFDQSATSLDPERILQAKEKLEQVRKLFAQDATARRVLELLGQGYSAKEIQASLTISPQEFDTVTKRIRRRLDSWQDREGAA